MTAQIANLSLVEKQQLQTNRFQHAGLFTLFLVCEAAIFIFGSHYFDVFPTNKNLTFFVVNTLALGLGCGT